MNRQSFSTMWRTLVTAGSLLILSACATGPTVRSDQAPDANLANYQTFGFMTELATDRGGYTSLVTQHLKAAVTAEMTARGYRFSEESPQLLVNFNSNVEQRTDIRTTTSAALAPYSYYHYRRGFYSPFPYYQKEVETVRYKIGTVNIDVVDAARKQLVWEGVAEGVLKRQDLEEPRQAMAQVVANIFDKFPQPRR
ncbi:DUF4136 domain-containing protein [Rheinheimera sp. UJ51]|uniref:DUF4136 domain-containing protein n=1 Tax=Rheinheimera sp. UJ51 TaxID=2892446 RepID=UPI001E5E23D6|nr:DUF4136 domain-containing protein [Rheinheimera sp. UJ51]MCC5450901.1 DUF4136 domain-containing protein [Rheinheimera sp. UJ51]